MQILDKKPGRKMRVLFIKGRKLIVPLSLLHNDISLIQKILDGSQRFFAKIPIKEVP